MISIKNDNVISKTRTKTIRLFSFEDIIINSDLFILHVLR